MPLIKVLQLQSKPQLRTGCQKLCKRKYLHAWAQRAQRAHTNAVENLVLFAPAVVILVALHRGTEATVMACSVYFWARVVHYLAFTFGIPFLRTLAYFTGLGVVFYILYVALQTAA